MKKNFKFIFNDRAFDDGWAEPYVVEVKTHESIDTDVLASMIEKAIRKVSASDDGIYCSEEGVTQILKELGSTIACSRIVKLDYDFEFGNLNVVYNEEDFNEAD